MGRLSLGAKRILLQRLLSLEPIMCMRFRWWPMWIVFPKAKANGVFITCLGTLPNGPTAGWGQIIIPLCLHEIRKALNQADTNR